MLFWPFYRLLQLYDLKCQKTHISAISVHKYHKSFFLAYLTVLRLIAAVWVEISKNSYLRDFSAQISQISFLILFDCSTAYYKCKTWNVRKLILPRFQCTSIRNRFLSLFDRFKVYYKCMTWNVRKLLFPRFQCTSITNRFLSLFDGFTAYYNGMTWNVGKLITPRFQCTSITNRLYGLSQLYELNCQKAHIATISVQRY